MGRLGFVPRSHLDAKENERRIISAHSAEIERRLSRTREDLYAARDVARRYRRELDEVYALRTDVSGYFSVRAYEPAETADLPVVELRVEPMQHAIRFFAMDHRLMRARPADYARRWGQEIARQLEPKLTEAVLDGLRRI